MPEQALYCTDKPIMRRAVLAPSQAPEWGLTIAPSLPIAV